MSTRRGLLVLVALLLAEAVLGRLPGLVPAAVGVCTLLTVLAAQWTTPWGSAAWVTASALLLIPWPLDGVAIGATAVAWLVCLGVTRFLQTLTGRIDTAQRSAMEQLGVRNEAERRHRAERSELSAQVAHWASHDHLTDVLNRSAVTRHLQQQARAGLRTGVLVVSMAGFTGVNDALGPDVGDELLAALAVRLRGRARDVDLVARLGGDEFAVVLPGLTEDVAVPVARRLLQVLADPFTVGPHVVALHARCGLALDDGAFAAGPAELLRQACSAARTARVDALPGVSTASAQAEVRAALQLESDLQRAVREDELFLLYQPLVSTRTGRIESVEALVRWHHPEHGLVSPADFIPCAERTGLIVELGTRVLELALTQLRAWASGPAASISMAVNVSARQLVEPGFVAQVQAMLRRSGVDPRQVVLELTESLLVEDSAAAIEVLWQLRSLGVRLALDDFGTGYSSLARLGELPLDEMKIDKSFVDRLGAVANDSTVLVTAAIAMGQGLGLTVVAEGVEAQGQADALRRLGCDLLQGFLLARPQSAEAVAAQAGHQLLADASFPRPAALGLVESGPYVPGIVPDVSWQ